MSGWLDFRIERVIRPGDALKCIVSIEHRYGFDNELIGEYYTISEVQEVLENTVAEQRSILDNEDSEEQSEVN